MEKLDFGTKLIDVRKAKGLTQEEVAEKCKITVRTIQRVESGLVQPRAYTIKTISDVLGFDFFETSDTGYVVNEVNQNPIFEKRNILWYLKDLFNLKTNAMKKISVLTTSFLIIGLSMFVFVSKLQAQQDNKNIYTSIITKYNSDKSISRIEVRFSTRLTFDSLVYIQNDLKLKGITVDYKTINFDEKGNLKEIYCHVNTKLSGNSGAFGLNFSMPENKDRRIGFFYDFSKNAKPTFCTGACDL